jgi:hypothetical protein
VELLLWKRYPLALKGLNSPLADASRFVLLKGQKYRGEAHSRDVVTVHPLDNDVPLMGEDEETANHGVASSTR